MSKLSQDRLTECLETILKYSTDTKKRNFVETVELQIGLKNYDVARDKRFSGSVALPHICKPKINVLIIADQKHVYECEEKKMDFIDVDGLKAFKKNKKQIKKWANKFDALIASDSLIRQIPRIAGPQLNKMGKFPSPVSHDVALEDKISELQHTVKFTMKKVLCLGVAVGHVGLTIEELRENLTLAINTLIGLLKKGWQNIGSLNIKSSMGPVQRLY
eukprot:TRINITY_DN12616_c0_g1_i1.p2 TRINITY_DN12616_c0_g1~~TRINITY_DN12616_c0_g1_i1.p2  ORF type:complete len:218 (+),score=71.05 TRINITY_DN12616_c0_g1_i1:18-671(+)